MTVSRKDYEAALDKMEPVIRAAFLDAIRRMTSRAQIAALENALVRGDLDAALAAIGYSENVLDGLAESIRQSYIEGGALIAAAAPAAVRYDFSANTERAQRWLRQNSSELITAITESMRQTIQDTLADALQRGQNPRRTALDLVGRINRRTQQRSGGLIGLTRPDTLATLRMRRELASGDPVLMSRYFGRAARDKRFDSLVHRALRAGERVAAADIERISARYSDRLLRLRGEVIARTETLQSVNAAQSEAIQQATDQGLVDPSQTVKVWRTAADRRVREFHEPMNGDTAMLDEPFTSGSGAQLMFPGDRSLGAQAEDLIQCRCQVIYRVDWIESAARRAA